MNNKLEGTFAILSAILVLFSAMLKPVISVILAISLLIIFAIYIFIKK